MMLYILYQIWQRLFNETLKLNVNTVHESCSHEKYGNLMFPHERFEARTCDLCCMNVEKVFAHEIRILFFKSNKLYTVGLV